MDFQLNSEAEEEVGAPIETDFASDDTLLENVDTLDVCYMSVSHFNQKCGSAIYYPSDGRILLVDQIEDNEYENLVSLVWQLCPNHLIINAKSDAKLIGILEGGAKPTSEPMSSTSTSQSNRNSTPNLWSTCDLVEADAMWKMDSRYDLHVMSHTLFAYENCKTRIASLNFKDRSFADQKDKLLYLSSIIDFSDSQTFRSLGALLRFLDNHLVDMQNQKMGTTVEVSSIDPYSLKQLMVVERNTYESLQVFQQEWHPSVAKQGINQKEGLSLFGLFNCCVSKVGAIYLRKIFLLPTQETTIILERLNTIEFFVDSKNLAFRDDLRQQLKHVKGVTALFSRLSSDAFTVNDLLTLQRNLRYALKLRDIIGNRSGLQVFDQIKESFDNEMDDMMMIFSKVVDFNKSVKNQSFEINTGIDKELDQSKYVFNKLPEMLNEVAKKELVTFKTFRQCNCVYLPQIGFLTCVEVEADTLPHETETGLKFVIKIGNCAYYKTSRTDELDKLFGDIQSDITDRQIQIITELKDVIWKRRHIFISIVRCCAKLDALIAMSRTALEFHYVRPEISTGDTIDIIEGRHPLIELMFKTFVSNDYRSGGEFTQTKLISGPNACGKSVYLKQICLIVYMAHIGSFVPAMAARIPIVNRMFTRIQSPESVSMRLSTFMLDLKQMSTATKYANRRSLVVIDEFGKGTQPIDGLALMAASINHLMDKGSDSPHLVVSSHFKSLPALIDRKQLVECLTFELDRVGKRINYLYKLIDGHSDNSIASYIAKLTEIPEQVVDKGTAICDAISNNQRIDFFDVKETEDKYRSCEEVAKNFLRLYNSEEQILNFFASNFSEYFRSHSEE